MAHFSPKAWIPAASRALALGILCLFWSGGAVADPVRITASQQPGAGRLTFAWPAPVPFVAEIAGRQLVVQFGRPVESNLAGLPGPLARYIGTPRLTQGGRVVVFPLQGTFDLNFFSQGNSVIVEVVDTAASPPRAQAPAQSTAQTPAQAPASPPAPSRPSPPPAVTLQPPPPPQASPPQPAAPRAAAQPPAATAGPTERIGVRTGEHEQYGRIVFDWERDVGYRLEQRGNRAYVTFERPATIALDAVRRGRARNVAGGDVAVVGNTTVVTLNVPSSSRIQTLKSGTRVVVDVYNPTGANDASQAATQPPPGASAAAPSAPEAARAPAPAASPPAAPPAQAQSAAPPPPAPTPLTAPQAQGNQVAAALPSAATQPASLAPPLPGVEATWRVDWTEPVGAAVFRRAGNLWIVFDRTRQVDTAAAATALRGLVQSVSQLDAPRGTFLRLITAPDINPSIRRDGFAWIFDFRRQPMRPATAIEAKMEQGTGSDVRVLAAVAQPGEALPLRDPEVGDNVVVVPVIPLAHGVERLHAFPQFEVLPSAQGIVVRPRIDDLRVRPVQRGVELAGTTAPLVVSPLTPQAQANARIGSFRQVSRIFTPDSWRVARRLQGMGEFVRESRTLLDKVADAASAPARQHARLEYAQFLVANDWGYEAMGVLDTMEMIDPNIQFNAEFRLLKGITEYLIDRFDDAGKTLAFAGLEGNDEGELWRAIVLAAGGKPREAAPTLKARGDVFRSYPRALKMKVGMAIANSALAVGDVLMANGYLQVLAEEKPEGNEIDQLALIEGKVHQLSGDFDSAVAAWEAVEKGAHRPSMAEAIVLRAELLLARKKIEPKEAIAELEKLRFSWRGGEFEFRLLHRLGQLYNSIGDYRNGLRTLQEAVTYFREMPESAKVTEEMVKAFDDLYLKDAADSMAPVRAIALFDEFKELAPSGERGDEMIRKLADRLAAVDLLDRAAQLLSDQVQFRLKGVERARIGARLATVHLLNRQPTEAEAALARSGEANLPADLEMQRRHLLARALVDQGRVPDAERLLERDESAEADQLRAEIYWGLRDWANASKSLQKLVANSGAEPGVPLSEAQAQTILNYAIAVTLTGNERVVTKLRQDFGPAMGATPLRDAFNLIATPSEVGLVDFRSVADRVKVAANFSSFLDAYKKRLKEGKLSSLN